METEAIQQVIGHELALLTPEVRQSRQALDGLLDPEFREIGASGRFWTRPEIVTALVEAVPDVEAIPTSEMEGVFVTPDVILLTYISDPAGRAVLRSSLWRRRDGRWQLLHHQGTSAARVSEIPGRMTSPHVEPFYASLPQRYVGSGVLITDEAGAILMVEPVYKSRWEVPGGVTEISECTSSAARRECSEELGIVVDVGRPLVIEHQTVLGRGDSIMFIYDGGTLPQDVELNLPAVELRSYRFVAASDLDALTSPRLANRLRVALHARSEGTLVELHNGQRVS